MELTEEFYRELLDNLAVGVYFLDVNREITYWNNSATKLTGFTREETVGKCCADNFLRHLSASGEPLCNGAKCPALKTMQEGKAHTDYIFLHHKDGYRIPVFVHVNPIYDNNGKIIGALESFTDATQEMTLLEKVKTLKNAALFDKATGCAKKAYIDLMLQAWLEEKKITNWDCGLLLIEIDGLKKLKNQCGESAVQTIVAAVSQTLRHCAKGQDLLGYQEKTGFFYHARSQCHHGRIALCGKNAL